jgi:hypothetical protein
LQVHGPSRSSWLLVDPKKFFGLKNFAGRREEELVHVTAAVATVGGWCEIDWVLRTRPLGETHPLTAPSPSSTFHPSSTTSATDPKLKNQAPLDIVYTTVPGLHRENTSPPRNPTCNASARSLSLFDIPPLDENSTGCLQTQHAITREVPLHDPDVRWTGG